MEDNSIQEGTKVILLINGQTYQFCTVGKEKVRIKKRQFSSAPLVGSHYGDIFIGNKELVRDYDGIYSGETLGIGLADDDGQDDEQEQQADGQAKEGGSDESRDNRSLVDDNTSQKLNAEDVASLANRADGYTLIAELCKGSATFKGKTKYSQEKYIKKKAMKYLPSVQVLPVSSDLLCRIYYDRNKANYNMRPDALSRLLEAASLTASSNAIVVDGTNGVLTAAVAERIGADGSLTVLYTGNEKSVPRYSTLTLFPQNRLAKVSYLWLGNILEGNESVQSHFEKYDALLVASAFSPVSIIPSLLPLLRPSASICVASALLSPLVELSDALRSCCCDVDISEAWLREYQVIAQRTHPTMTMDGASGYQLSAVYVGSDAMPTKKRKVEEEHETEKEKEEAKEEMKKEDADEKEEEKEKEELKK